MLSKSWVPRLGLCLLAAALAFGIWELFALRLEGGDVYPPYSTLRADPVGARAFRDALAEMPGLRVERNFLPLVKFHPAAPVTLIYAGLERHSTWEPAELPAFEALVKTGNRAVFAFLPEPCDDGAEQKRAEEERKKEQAKAEGKKAPADPPAATPSDRRKTMTPESAGKSFRAVAAGWGFGFALARGKSGAAYSHPAVLESGGATLEGELPWHSALCFSDLQPAWRVLYRAEGRPVVIERTLGQGTLVLASDAYFLSNEALHSPARAPQFLSWLVGTSRQIVFDEDHHGLRAQTGIAQLMRKYRLHGLFAGLAVLAALFLWKESVPFLPPPASGEEKTASVTGRSSPEGLRTLLRRSVPPAKLIETCLSEWRGSASPSSRARVEQTWAALPARERRPVAAWRALTEAARTWRKASCFRGGSA